MITFHIFITVFYARNGFYVFSLKQPHRSFSSLRTEVAYVGDTSENAALITGLQSSLLSSNVCAFSHMTYVVCSCKPVLGVPDPWPNRPLFLFSSTLFLLWIRDSALHRFLLTSRQFLAQALNILRQISFEFFDKVIWYFVKWTACLNLRLFRLFNILNNAHP